ncbi:MAG: TonB-dependent receptor plug domain-containing protein [Opitutaceae bacterium]|nr:TonB-dependent receptor plug domain-containing protein [Opitutaceae bacterium]
MTATTQNQVPPPIDDDIIMLSPFQVDATKEKGYFAENTLAGSRMRTNIADLGAAISVVTKQQLEDTASLDINDVFRYEIGTEGATTYTPTQSTFRVGGIVDAIAGNTFGNSLTTTVTNSTANRVRGLGTPGFAINYYTAIAQIPFDSYNAASFEINRGPNSLLFGMGSPAGIVNMSTATPQINKDSASVQVRIDDRSSERVSLSFNKTLVDGKLAVYGALLYDDKQYKRKPSYDTTRRQYGAITYKPFKHTKITASVEGYNNDNRRPNTITPIDGVSEWRAAGRPYYDSLRQEIISMDTNQTMAPYVASIDSSNAQAMWDYLAAGGITVADLTASGVIDSHVGNYTYKGASVFGSGLITTKYFTDGSVNPFYVPGVSFQTGRASHQIADGALQQIVQGSQRQRLGFGNYTSYDQTTGAASTAYGALYAFDTGYARYPTFGNVYDNPGWAAVYDRSWTESAMWQSASIDTGILSPFYKGVTDRSIYDWKNVNVLSMNFATQRNTTYNIELEQEIIPGLITLSAGWFRQDFDSLQSYTVANMNATQLQVDTNKYYPDGSENPYFGSVYVLDQDPDRYGDSWTTDQYRAMVAITPDFTKNKGWTKWLGRHNFLGLASYYDQERTTWRKRLAYYTNSSQMVQDQYMPDQSVATWQLQGATASRRHFYLSNGEDRVTQATGKGAYNNDEIIGTIRLYDYATGQWRDEQVSMVWNDFNAGTERTARKLTSYSAAWQGYLWDDRIITTFGVRRDINRTRGTTTSGLSNADLFVNGVLQTDKFFDRWNEWSRLAGTTTSTGVVVKPFLKWDYITKRSSDNLFWEFVENLGFSYNKSDNFDAPSSTGVDYYGNVLPKPVGNGKDMGVQFSLLKNKLFARINWYEATNENALSSPTAMQRLYWHIDSTAYRSWLGMIYMLNTGLVDPINDASWQDTAKTFAENNNAAITDRVAAMQTWVAEKWGLGDWDYYNNLGGTLAGTSKVKAKGTEVTVQYNPLPNWTIKLTASKNTTTNSDVLKEYLTWKAYRKDQWDAADARTLLTGNALATYGNGVVDTLNNSKILMGTFWESYGYYDTEANSGAGGGTTITWNASDPGYRSNEAFYNAVLIPQELSALATDGQQVMGQRKYNGTVLTNYNFERGALKGWSVGGAQRYASKAIIGYYGKASGANKDALGRELLDIPDVTRPRYDDAMWYTDLWVAYTRKIFNNKVRMKLQLNVSDVFQDGELQPVAVGYDGEPYAYRILDSRQFILTATFDF